MSIQLGILGSSSGVYVRDLSRAADELGAQVHFLGYPELQTSIAAPALQTAARQQITTEKVKNTQSIAPLSLPDSTRVVAGDWLSEVNLDALIVRTMPLGSLEQVIFRMDCLQVWQCGKTLVINSPRCLETSIDKWLTLHRLHAAGVSVPSTVSCQSREQALEAMSDLGNDVLLKPLFGGEGRGIIRLQDRDLAWRVLSTLQQLGHVLYLQQFLPNFGYDIRVLVVGDQLLSIRRYTPVGGYRSNVSQGGIAQPHTLSDLQRELALQAAKAVDGQVVGVDLLPARDGKTYVLEVNAVPGWKGVASSLSVDVAKQIVRYAIERVESNGNH
jgi:RimK family alpha-L-glutamate ligase